MTEDAEPKVSTNSAALSTDASQTRQRKKRKWDQPADSLVSAGLAVPGVLPVGNMGYLAGIALPGVAPTSGAIIMNPLLVSSVTKPQVFQAPQIQQQSASVASKLKIQDELIIAREIVINDAESSVRYKLTKRQIQEEIQRCTGAVVITRGKYHPPNSPPDGEKPLYLHISAGAHLKETAERIIAVDRATAMVEEMLKGQNLLSTSSGLHSVMSNEVKASSTCVFLGFDADPSLNIASRIRGPNDQYINHIMNETGATVLLRGHGSGSFESAHGEGQQPLHLFLSSSNPKSLEDAKRLAENLLDTISVECGASRVSSGKAYSAVPPLQQMAGVLSSGKDMKITGSAIGSTSLTVGSPAPSVTIPAVTTVFSQGTAPQPGGLLNCAHPHQNVGGYPQHSLPGGTSYSGYYGGIYPQATPLQQVALALRQSSSSTMSMVAPSTPVASSELKSSSNLDKEKRPPQRRKFQELPVGSKIPNPHQGVDFPKSSEPTAGLGVRNISTMPAPKKLVQLSSNGMPLSPPKAMPPPPRPKSMPPPPPPPKFSSSTTVKVHDKTNILNKTIPETVPDTLVKLMEYGEDDDDEETSKESPSNCTRVPGHKPFWAL